MSYTKTTWVNNTTPINDTNLNKIEQGIYDNSTRIETQVVTTANTDLNDYIENGEYYFDVGRAPINRPAGTNGWLQVIKGADNNTVKQLWFRHGTVNTNDYETYVRTFTGGTWSSWTKLATENELETWTNISSGVVFNTDLVTSEECRCYVNSKIKLCYVHLSVKAVANNSGSIVNSGLPKALSSLGLNGLDLSSNPRSPIQVWARSVGDIKTGSTLVSGNSYYINGCYPYSTL